MKRVAGHLGYDTVYILKKPAAAAAMSKAVKCHGYGGSQIIQNISKHSQPHSNLTHKICIFINTVVIWNYIGSMTIIYKYDGNL
jgi:hypothetical protein